MFIKKKYQQRLREQDCCIIIPTYNNAQTLNLVLQEVLEYTPNLIVVNDGSTDATPEILKRYKLLQLISFSSNKGKGAALKVGFAAAEKLGFEYAISMDSDGQHYADDILVFLNELENHNSHNPLLLIGSRQMEQEGVPKKSLIGNRFSSFWFKVETGVRLVDTQCGFRLYPVKLINQLSLLTTRFEFEIEIIVKASWAGAEVRNVPIKVYYDEQDRVTHFRPWQDTARIVVLNTYFVLKRSLNLLKGS